MSDCCLFQIMSSHLFVLKFVVCLSVLCVHTSRKNLQAPLDSSLLFKSLHLFFFITTRTQSVLDQKYKN